jgi:hypothetical protein
VLLSERHEPSDGQHSAQHETDDEHRPRPSSIGWIRRLARPSHACRVEVVHAPDDREGDPGKSELPPAEVRVNASRVGESGSGRAR